MKINFKKIHADAIMPTYATDGSGCFDFYACEGKNEKINWCSNITITTGIAIEIPAGYALLIFGRSGHAFNYNVRLANCAAVIDSDFRGQIMIKLTQDKAITDRLQIEHGMRIAQGMIIPVPKIEFVEVAELSETARGAGGMGSTGL